MTDDAAQLRRYAQEGAEQAFVEVVARHLPLVYSAALRQVGGDEQLAKDIAQTVFIALARNAGSLYRRELITRWLYTTTRYIATKTVRGEPPQPFGDNGEVRTTALGCSITAKRVGDQWKLEP